jgi:hypothetical protein
VIFGCLLVSDKRKKESAGQDMHCPLPRLYEGLLLSLRSRKNFTPSRSFRLDRFVEGGNSIVDFENDSPLTVRTLGYSLRIKGKG